MDEYDYDLPKQLRELMGIAYIRALAGDAYNRVNYTGSYLTLLGNAFEIIGSKQTAVTLFGDKSIDIKKELREIALEYTEWGNALKDLQIEERQGHGVWLCQQILSRKGHFVYKLGTLPAGGFSILDAAVEMPVPTTQGGGNT